METTKSPIDNWEEIRNKINQLAAEILELKSQENVIKQKINSLSSTKLELEKKWEKRMSSE